MPDFGAAIRNPKYFPWDMIGKHIFLGNWSWGFPVGFPMFPISIWLEACGWALIRRGRRGCPIYAQGGSARCSWYGPCLRSSRPASHNWKLRRWCKRCGFLASSERWQLDNPLWMEVLVGKSSISPIAAYSIWIYNWQIDFPFHVWLPEGVTFFLMLLIEVRPGMTDSNSQLVSNFICLDVFSIVGMWTCHSLTYWVV